VQSIDYTDAGGATLRSFDYAYDVFGNLGQEDLNSGATREVYDYDNLQRLTEATRTGGATGTVDYTYDAVGNLTSKSDFSTAVAGAYSYAAGTCGGGPNAVKSVALSAGGTRTYCYDAAGNMTSDDAGMTARYDHTQRPLQINKAGAAQFFDYSPAGERMREWGSDGEVAFFGLLERRYSPAANDKLYVGSNTLITQSGSSRVVTYLLTDRLGSVDAIANSAGVLIETRGFDAFGKPRTGTWGDATPPRLTSTATTHHGFTGHEHLDSLQLIHMNGRVYDYNLGRFMGVDPLIQFPLNTQSLNPYSYILNNPLSGKDPTGYATCNASEVASTSECAQVGVHTIVGESGQKTTLIVGQKGDNISLVGKMDVAKFKDLSNGALRIAYNPGNGADAWVKNGPKGEASEIGTPSAKGCAALSCYDVQRGANGSVASFERTFDVDKSHGAINGMMNELGYAISLMSEHVNARFAASDFTLVYNPTQSFLSDLWEATRDKFGHTTEISRHFSEVLVGMDHHADWVAHSQGGVIFAEAARYAEANVGAEGLRLNSVAFDSGANNAYVTDRILARGGLGLYGKGYYDAPNDAVPQIVGLRGWSNPVNMAWSVVSFPTLFGDHSPHTHPQAN